MAESKEPMKTGTKTKKPPKRKKSTKAVKDTIQESIVMKMKQDEQKSAPRNSSKENEWDLGNEFRKSRKKSAPKEINFFLRQMAILLNAGVPLMRALKILTNRIRNSDFRMALVDIMAEVEKGSQLWAAMSNHPKFFNSMATNTIRTGEESGSLVAAMNYLANYRDRESDMLRSVERAVTYPLFLLILAIGVVFVLITMVIPVFAEQFAAAKVALPWPTKLVFGLSDILSNIYVIAIILAVIGYVVYKKVDLSKGVAPFWDRVKIRLPVFGRILVNIYTVQFATMMSLLLKSGLPLTKTIELVRDTMTNTLFKKAFSYIKANIERGRTLNESLEDVKVFPPIVMDMIAVGEEAGSLPEILDQVADYYQKEVDHDTAVIGTLLEPIMIVSLGLIIGFIAVSVFMPYFKMASFIGG